MKYFVNYFHFFSSDSGKLDRKSYFAGQLPCVGIIMFLIYINHHTHSNFEQGATAIFGMVFVLYAIFATVSRLHDAGHTGWWWLISPIAAIMICQPTISKDTDKKWDKFASLLLVIQFLLYVYSGFHLL
ncbi:DUF805 domain-containing protein [Lactococcus nasutitermitis]|uniref:DUF805 domain-containing protein n=1 Tax=Lactococcus nasutitermitis TaxID=1652957 RepID=A0ABV9JA69_9LACT|nr:DUF805 domain-containing protein [Lactococcus nasutitermitis]